MIEPRASIDLVKHGKTLRGAGLILVALCALCSLPVAQAAVSSERILDFQSDIRVQPDASLLVRETIRVRSAGAQIRHGIYRDFPTHYKDRLGNRYIVDFKVVEVSRDGQPEKFQLQDQTTLGDVRNTDMASASVDLAREQTSYQAAIQAESTVPRTSLFNFLTSSGG